jgi:hypothetical protein
MQTHTETDIQSEETNDADNVNAALPREVLLKVLEALRTHKNAPPEIIRKGLSDMSSADAVQWSIKEHQKKHADPADATTQAFASLSLLQPKDVQRPAYRPRKTKADTKQLQEGETLMDYTYLGQVSRTESRLRPLETPVKRKAAHVASRYGSSKHTAKTKLPAHTASLAGKAQLLTLPLELREKIYTLAMEDLPTDIMITAPKYSRELAREHRELFWSPNRLPGICYASKYTWNETRLVYIRRIRFVTDGLDGVLELCSWLREFEYNQGFKAIRMLGVTGEALASTNETWDLLCSCSGLRSLHIRIDDGDVYSKYRGLWHNCEEIEGVTGPRNRDDSSAFTKLETVKIFCKTHYGFPINYTKLQQFFRDYVSWMREKFSLGDRDVEFEFEGKDKRGARYVVNL